MKLISVKKIFGSSLLLFIIFSVLAISYLRLADNFELGSLDLRFSLRPKIPTTDKIIIIEIGEDSIKKLGRFPFDRSYHAILIKALSEFGAKTISFDIFFSEPQDHDNEVEEAMREGKFVYLPFVFDIDQKNPSRIIAAKGYLAKCLDNMTMLARGVGHINIIPDMDGKFRRVPIYIRYQNALYPYLPFLVACDYLGISEHDVKLAPGKYILLGSWAKIPLDESSSVLVNFSGKWGTSFKHYSYVDVLQSYFAYLTGKEPLIDPKEFKDKICMIGVTAAGTGDVHPSPLETLYPGVGIHAEIFSSILHKRFISRASKETNLIILIIMGFLISIVTMKTKPIRGLLMLLAIGFAFATICILSFIFYGVWIDMVYPLSVIVLTYISLTLYKYLTEWRKRLVMENELQIAKKIQESFLPKVLPAVDGIDIAASMFTARQVGGDLYDFLDFGEGKLGVIMGDVSGKGVPASLFMAMVVGAYKSFAGYKDAPREVLANLNSKLVRESSSNLFVTVFYSVFDMKLEKMAYANGGHLPVLYIANSKNAQFLDVKEGAPLGLMEGPYTGAELHFDPGDVFIFYTDGVTEAMNRYQELYGRERLVKAAQSGVNRSAKGMLEAIYADIRKFEPAKSQHDDMTLVVVKII